METRLIIHRLLPAGRSEFKIHVPFPSLSAPLDQALAERGYNEPTPVQSAVLEPKVAGRDLLVSAQTGSGKTIAYGLAIHADLLGQQDRFGRAAAPLALVVAPTRELALQVQRELQWLYAKTGAEVEACVGGMDPRREARALQNGAHMVIGTPGRLRDHIERGRLDLSALAAVVLDEADEMLDLGFREDLEFILDATAENRRTLMFSATMPKGIAHLASRYQKNAERIAVAGAVGGHADIEYRAIRIMPHEAEHAVVNILRFIDAPSAIVFCNTREAVRHLHAGLLERGFSAVALSGELSQSERNHALQALRDKRARVCIATDVAARGIDLPSLGLVIHTDLPRDPEALQHRSGRTGRAGRKGVSVLLVSRSQARRAERLFSMAGVQPSWSAPPSVDEIRVLDQQRLLQDPILTEPVSDEDAAFVKAIAAERTPDDLAAALVRLYRSQLPALEEVSDPGFRSESQPGRAGDGARPARTADQGTGTWFRLNVGRSTNADPRRLLPMLCRRGSVSRDDIGAIRIFDHETKVEIRPERADHFAESARRSEGVGAVRIERLDEPQRGHAREGKRGGHPQPTHQPERKHRKGK